MPRKSTRKRSFLILTSTFPRWENDNVTTFVFDFAKYIKNKNWAPLVLAPHYPGAQKKEEMEGVEVKRFQYWFTKKGQTIVYNGGAVPGIKKTPLYGLKVAGYTFTMLTSGLITVLKQNIPILNPHWLIPQGFIAILIKCVTGKKVVVTIHGSDVFSLNGKVMRFIKRWVLKKADEVVVNSSATLEKTRSLYDGREYHVIPMGIDTDHFSPSEPKKSQDNKFNILYVGRLSEEKGVMYLCHAIKQLVYDNYKNANLVIVGSGPEEDEINNFVRDNELESYVKVAGWINPSELPDYYRNADVFVGPSIITETGGQEAFGLVFAESLATATPVIATKTGGIKDIVIDGENGFLVPDKDPSAIANKLKLVMDDRNLLEQMKLNAREHIVNNFSWDIETRKYDRVFSNIGGRK